MLNSARVMCKYNLLGEKRCHFQQVLVWMCMRIWTATFGKEICDFFFHNLMKSKAKLLKNTEKIIVEQKWFWNAKWNTKMLSYKTVRNEHLNVYGHTTLNTPVLVRSPKLSNVGPGQYLDGRPPGNGPRPLQVLILVEDHQRPGS